MSMHRLPWLASGLFLLTGVASAQDLSGLPVGALNRAPAATQSAPAGWNGAAAYYLLGTFGENSQAFTTNAALASSSTQTDFPSPLSSAAAFWLGWGGPGGLGLRGHYFFRVESPNPVTTTITVPQVGTTAVLLPPSLAFAGGPTFAAPGALLTAGFGTDLVAARRALDIHQFDFEGTFTQPFGRGQLVFAAGGRYMFIIQDYTASLTNTVIAGTLSEAQALTFHRAFHGGGPTVAGELRAPLGPIIGYCSARGSVLAGAYQENENFTQTIVDTGAVAGGSRVTTNASSGLRSTVIPVGELEIGVQINSNYRSYPVGIRAGVVTQSYFNAGTASDPRGNLHLFGVQLGLNVGF